MIFRWAVFAAAAVALSGCQFVSAVDSVAEPTELYTVSPKSTFDADLPAVRVQSTSGVAAELGEGDELRTVSGPDASLWAWLMGRTPDQAIEGADGLTPALRS